MRTSLIIGTLMAAGLALTGCSSSEVPSPQAPAPGTPPPPSAIAPASNGGTAKQESIDVRFAQQMIAHHEVEEQLVTIAETNTGEEGILRLAERIKREHPPTIERIKKWLIEDKQMEPEAAPEEVGVGEGPYMPSVGQTELSQLKEAQQGEFAPLWIESMISHHHQAMRIAHTELSEGTNPQMRADAQQIVAQRQSELDTLKSLQSKL